MFFFISLIQSTEEMLIDPQFADFVLQPCLWPEHRFCVYVSVTVVCLTCVVFFPKGLILNQPHPGQPDSWRTEGWDCLFEGLTAQQVTKLSRPLSHEKSCVCICVCVCVCVKRLRSLCLCSTQCCETPSAWCLLCYMWSTLYCLLFLPRYILPYYFDILHTWLDHFFYFTVCLNNYRNAGFSLSHGF